MFGGAFMRPEWGKDGSGQSPSERLFKLRLKATSAFTASYYPRALSGRFEAELRCTCTRRLAEWRMRQNSFGIWCVGKCCRPVGVTPTGAVGTTALPIRQLHRSDLVLVA